MQQTHRILKDFINHDFVEPTELSIFVQNEEHKSILKI